MSRSFTYDGATELAGATRLGSFSFTGAAHKGEVGDGGFDFDDPAAAANLVGLKPFTAEDDDSTPARFFSGFIADRGIGRGPFRVDSDRQWQTAVVDINSYLDDVLLRSDDANRPAETDVDRITWLLGSGALDVDDTYFITDDPVSMDAADYRGRHARDVLDECGEASGKNFFLRDDGDGPFLSYYDSTGSTDPAAGSISSVLSEVDNDTTFAPAWGDVPALGRDPSRVYSGVAVQYGDGQSVFVENGTTLSTFRRRETSVFDDAATTADGATTIANQFLEAASTEEDTLECPLILPSDKLGLYLEGQKVDTNFPHLGGSFSYRISRKTVAPAGEDAPSHDHYLVTLILTVPVKITRFSGRNTGANFNTMPGVVAPPIVEPTQSFWQFPPLDSAGGDVYFQRLDMVSAPASPAAYEVRLIALTTVGGVPVRADSALFLGFQGTITQVLHIRGIMYTPTSTPPTPPVIRIRYGSWPDQSTLDYDIDSGLKVGNGLGDAEDLGIVYPAGADIRRATIAEVTLTVGAIGGSGPYSWPLSGTFTANSVKQLVVETDDARDNIFVNVVDYAEDSSLYPLTPGHPTDWIQYGVADGSTDTITLAPYRPNSVEVTVGGIPWTDGYTEVDPASGTIFFTQVPVAGDLVEGENVIRYRLVAA